jgi:hypothetical protein
MPIYKDTEVNNTGVHCQYIRTASVEVSRDSKVSAVFELFSSEAAAAQGKNTVATMKVELEGGLASALTEKLFDAANKLAVAKGAVFEDGKIAAQSDKPAGKKRPKKR